MRTVGRRLGAFVFSLLVILGCSGTTQTATAGATTFQTPAPPATATSSTAPTTTPAATPTATASATAAPTLTATDAPTPSLEPSASSTASRAAATVQLFTGGGTQLPANGLSLADVKLLRPTDMAFGPDGSVWIVDGNLGMLVHVVADGTLADVTSGMLGPAGVTVTPDGKVYVSDRGNFRIVSYNGHGGLDVASGDSHFSGSSGDGGVFRHALFAQPLDLASDAVGNLYIDDAFNQKIRWVDAQTNIIDRLAGTGTSGFSGDGGPALDAEISTPRAIAVDVDGTELLIADSANVRLRRVDLVTGQIDTISGTGGGSVNYDPTLKGSNLPLGRIAAVAVDGAGNIYLPVFWGNMGLTLMRLDATDALTLLAGGGTGTAGSPPLQFALPDVLCIVPNPQTGDLLVCGSDGKIYNIPGAAAGAGP